MFDHEVRIPRTILECYQLHEIKHHVRVPGVINYWCPGVTLGAEEQSWVPLANNIWSVS